MQAGLNQRQKAAVIVRLLLDDDDMVSLGRLNDDSQTALAEEMAGMDLIDRHTRDAIISEFCDNLESVGLTFPGDLDGTLAMLGGRLSDDSNDRLRRNAVIAGRGDPWQQIAALSPDVLRKLSVSESVEVVALMLTKLPVEKASQVFTELDRERARRVAQAMSLTGGVTPQALRRVGLVLLQSAEALPRPAIDTPAADRMGAILNFASADLRDDVLGALEDGDTVFADGVRKAIFIFAHIPARVEPRDLPRILREVDQPTLVRALAAPDPDDAATAEFILSNLSQRMADNLREEIADLGKPRTQDIEDAKNDIIAAIRRLQEAGDLTLKLPADQE
ncbi:FliG C-terminal domain-containing protein [Paracoccus sp. (in: a-proteobacteria)]|uniref:FliG C-terminal domain-containing protein n=1 Tax=Paracoccus sp. TaxID=267 RepID=UPI0026DF2C1F|nr:FliG C-terminal domain-containing protein [Paracoccus sp. (in: a-proteobacteria)]MDO5646576.1 FliG C-terminal domain-containing protein [Paracoccus sp. (in: a-proteobacteria)]